MARGTSKIILGLTLVGALATVILVHRHSSENAAPAFITAVQVSAPTTLSGPGPSAAHAVTATATTRTPSDDSLRSYSAVFGPGAEIERTPSGRLVSLKGSLAQARPSPQANYSSANPQTAIARAREVIEALKEELGLSEKIPLGDPVAQASETSAQVYFTASYDGTPLMPSGTVTVDLGPHGEVLGVHNGYAGAVSVGPPPSLGSEQARVRALAAVENATRAQGGQIVIWTSPGASGGVDGRYAYVYLVQGRQVVVDGSTGAVLSQKDKRRD